MKCGIILMDGPELELVEQITKTKAILAVATGVVIGIGGTLLVQAIKKANDQLARKTILK